MQSNEVRKSLPLLILAVVLTGTALVCFKTFQPKPQKVPRPIEKLPYALDFQAPNYTMRSLAFEGRFPKVPSKMMVYKVIHPHVTEAYVRQLAQEHFGMPPDAEIKRSSGLSLYWLRSPDWELEVDPSNGSFSMSRMDRGSSQIPAEQREYPSAEDCKRIAVEYLNKHNLLPGDAYLDGLVDNTKSSWGAMSVGFGRKIRGYKSWGAGARISVEIGAGGQVVDLLKQWQEIVPYREYHVKSPQEAFEELENGKGVLMHGEKGRVKSITLRYYTSPQKQDYLQPVYYFDCAGPVHDFYGVVPAIKQECLHSNRLMPEQTKQNTDTERK
jgi:hypothetical protein